MQACTWFRLHTHVHTWVRRKREEGEPRLHTTALTSDVLSFITEELHVVGAATSASDFACMQAPVACSEAEASPACLRMGYVPIMQDLLRLTFQMLNGCEP